MMLQFEMSFVGRLGADPQFRIVGDQEVANFSVAVDKPSRDPQTGERTRVTQWINCAAWNGNAKAIAYMHKGEQHAFRGTPSVRTFVDRQGVTHAVLECSITDVVLLSNREPGAGNGNGSTNGNGNSAAARPATPPAAPAAAPAEAAAAATTAATTPVEEGDSVFGDPTIPF
jgi:single-strand DNA-binding protein